MNALAKREAMEALNDQQRKFVDAIVSGASNEEAVKLAGYADTTYPAHVLRGTAVQAAISAWCDAQLNGELKQLAVVALKDLLKEKTPAATRFAAAKLVLIETKPDERKGDKPLTEMSIDELEELIRRQEASLKDVTPSNGA